LCPSLVNTHLRWELFELKLLTKQAHLYYCCIVTTKRRQTFEKARDQQRAQRNCLYTKRY
jgi:hypothetical protein